MLLIIPQGEILFTLTSNIQACTHMQCIEEMKEGAATHAMVPNGCIRYLLFIWSKWDLINPRVPKPTPNGLSYDDDDESWCKR